MKHHDGPAHAAQQQPAAAATQRFDGVAVDHPAGWQAHIDRSPRMAAQRRVVQAMHGGSRKSEGASAQNGLPNPLKAGLQSLSGMDMSDVRVHRNSAKPAQLNALAYAQGNDIHLGPGQERHLPHEAWHVVQQRQGRVQQTVQAAGIGVNDDAGLEREADVMGARALMAGAGKQAERTVDLATASVQRTPATVAQRYVTFDPYQQEKVILGYQGLAGYDMRNVEALVDALFRGSEKLPMVLQMLGPFLGEKPDICFDSFESAAMWVLTGGEEPRAVKKALEREEKKEREVKPEIVWAFRMEGSPKSSKQLSDVQKYVTPDAAFDATMAELADAIKGHEPQVLALREQWNGIAAKDREKRLKDIGKLSGAVKKKSLNVKAILTQVNAKKEQFDEQIEQGEAFASRVYLDGSNMIPASKTSGTVTGLHSNINFSVGSADHASYFATTFGDKGGIVIRFALDKRLWRQWKIHKSGPQESGIGPRPPNMTTTLNDVAQPGVKYEMQEGKTFFEQVVVKDIPALVTQLPKNSTAAWKPTGEDLARTVKRLAKAQLKLELELESLAASTPGYEAERDQNNVAKQQLEKTWTPTSDKLADLYTAMNLTKNALHAVRRKKAE